MVFVNVKKKSHQKFYRFIYLIQSKFLDFWFGFIYFHNCKIHRSRLLLPTETDYILTYNEFLAKLNTSAKHKGRVL